MANKANTATTATETATRKPRTPEQIEQSKKNRAAVLQLASDFQTKSLEFVAAVKNQLENLDEAAQTVFGQLFELGSQIKTRAARVKTDTAAVRIAQIDNEIDALLNIGITRENFTLVQELNAEKFKLEETIASKERRAAAKAKKEAETATNATA